MKFTKEMIDHLIELGTRAAIEKAFKRMTHNERAVLINTGQVRVSVLLRLRAPTTPPSAAVPENDPSPIVTFLRASREVIGILGDVEVRFDEW